MHRRFLHIPLDMHTAPTQTRTDFESVLFGLESNYLPFERAPQSYRAGE